MRLPPEILEHLEARKNQEPEMELQAEYSEKHGPYISAWNNKQQEKKQ